MAEDLDFKAGYQDKENGPIVYVDGRDYFKKLEEDSKKKAPKRVIKKAPVKGE